MLQIDRPIARLARALSRHIPTGRRLRPLREWCARRYQGRDDRWVVIEDYRGTLKFMLDRSAYMGSMIYWHGYHHGQEISHLERKLRPDAVFLDVGANTGEFTIALAGRVPQGRVYAFEPQSTVRSLLEKNVALNGYANVSVLPFGLSDSVREASLYAPGDATSDAGFNEGLFTQFPSGGDVEQAGSAEFLPLDSLYENGTITRADWIKVDIEGGELFFLRGARKFLQALRPRLLLEVDQALYQAAGYSVDELLEFLAGIGYRPVLRNSKTRLLPCTASDIGNGPMNVVFEHEGG